MLMRSAFSTSSHDARAQYRTRVSYHGGDEAFAKLHPARRRRDLVRWAKGDRALKFLVRHRRYLMPAGRYRMSRSPSCDAAIT